MAAGLLRLCQAWPATLRYLSLGFHAHQVLVYHSRRHQALTPVAEHPPGEGQRQLVPPHGHTLLRRKGRQVAHCGALPVEPPADAASRQTEGYLHGTFTACLWLFTQLWQLRLGFCCCIRRCWRGAGIGCCCRRALLRRGGGRGIARGWLLHAGCNGGRKLRIHFISTAGQIKGHTPQPLLLLLCHCAAAALLLLLLACRARGAGVVGQAGGNRSCQLSIMPITTTATAPGAGGRPAPAAASVAAIATPATRGINVCHAGSQRTCQVWVISLRLRR